MTPIHILTFVVLMLAQYLTNGLAVGSLSPPSAAGGGPEGIGGTDTGMAVTPSPPVGAGGGPQGDGNADRRRLITPSQPKEG